MSSMIKILNEKSEKFNLPKFIDPNCIQYETILGSKSYGCNLSNSDTDIYSFCIPPIRYTLPNLVGEIKEFSNSDLFFETFQVHGINYDNEEYDVQIFNIIKYFKLLTECNPNTIDSIFTPERCILHKTDIGNLVRENRKLFICKELVYNKFNGYAYSQLKKLNTKNPNGKRKELIDKYGYDLKFAYHLIRLIYECKQMLETGDLDLEQNKDLLISIKKGEFTKEEVIEQFYSIENSLTDVYQKCTLNSLPRYNEIKQLLWVCLEQYYGRIPQYTGSKIIFTIKIINNKKI